MPEWEREVTAYETSYTCDCGSTLKFTGITDNSKVHLGEPILYQHRCDECGDVGVFDKKYPSIDFK